MFRRIIGVGDDGDGDGMVFVFDHHRMDSLMLISPLLFNLYLLLPQPYTKNILFSIKVGSVNGILKD